MEKKQNPKLKPNPLNLLAKKKNINRFNTLIYLLLVIGFFFLLYRYPLRLDLTRANAFTLSEASKNLVENLNDPIRIKVFISENLPAPLNEVEINLRDILAEYNDVGGEQFTYTFYDIDEKKEEESSEMRQNLELASQYGIAPQQVQSFDKDEVKLVKAYLGLVLEYGNALERIPFLGNQNSLEYQLTELISKLTRKNDKLIGLPENIGITLYLNEDFVVAGKFFGIRDLEKVSDSLKPTIDKIKVDNFNKVDFQVKENINQQDRQFLQSEQARSYPWNAFTINNVGNFPAGVGYANLVIELGDKIEVIELLNIENTLQLTAEGIQQVTAYVLTDLGENLAEAINGSIESLLDVNEKIAYLQSKGAVGLISPANPLGGANIFGGGQQAEGANFYNALSRTYSVDAIDLIGLSEKYNSLIIAGTSEEFSDYDLYLVDQFLMAGKSIIFFQDAFISESPNPQAPPVFRENPNRLGELLTHYGINVEKSVVLDKGSYVARQQTPNGGIQETKVYFAPIVRKVNNDFKVLQNIKEFISLQNASLALQEDNFKKHNNIKSYELYYSSEDSWLMKDNISLIPQSIVPPVDENAYSDYTLAYILEGEFQSFFKDKQVPAKPVAEEGDEENASAEINNQQIASSLTTTSLVQENILQKVDQGKLAKIMVVGSSQVIKNNIFNEAGGAGVNAVYLLNLIDYMNNREDWGVMRGKGQNSNPLEQFDEKAGLVKKTITNRDFLKFFNMIGLPVLVALIGLLAFSLRKSRKNKIMTLYKS